MPNRAVGHTFSTILFLFLLQLLTPIGVAEAQTAPFFRVDVRGEGLPPAQRDRVAPLAQDVATYLNSPLRHPLVLPDVPTSMGHLTIRLRGVEGDAYVGDLFLEVNRPIYRHTALSPLLRLVEQNVEFRFTPGATLRPSGFEARSNLEAILSAYKLLSVGLWAESFGQGEGMPYLKAAADVAEYATGQPSWSGWTPRGLGVNRYTRTTALVREVEMPSEGELTATEIWYRYHRDGLDQLSEKREQAVEEIKQLVRSLEQLYQSPADGSATVWLQIWSEAKVTELLSIVGEDSEIKEILKRLFPSNFLVL